MCNVKLQLFIAAFVAMSATGHSPDGYQTVKHNRAKRDIVPLAHEIYSLDNFISLVEKIETHPATSKDSLETVANYVRTLAYDNILWTYLVGKGKKLPQGVLNSEEERVLKDMAAHGFEGTREMGVIRTPQGETIALGHVITGVIAGLNRDEDLSLAKWASDSPKTIDNLFAATVSGDLGQTGLAKNNGDQTKYFGPAGQWTTDQCPAKYNRNASDEETGATDAELLGDIDGFILGHAVNGWKKLGVRLGQLFKMYYGDGVVYDKSYKDCNRWSKFKELVEKTKLTDEVEGFSNAYYYKYADNYKNVKTNDLGGIAKHTVAAFYDYVDQLSTTSQTCAKSDNDEACEIPANIVFVMDESGSIGLSDFSKEKSFVKSIVTSFDISPLQARVAVVEYSWRSTDTIGLHDYNSKTPLLCAIDNIRYSGGATRTAAAIELVNSEVLGPEQDQPRDSKRADTVSLVILLTDGKSNDPVENALEHEVSRIKKDIKGLTMIAVGVANFNLTELRLIATDPNKHVFTVDNFDDLVNVVKSIRKKACDVSADLDIDFRQTENETEIVAYVSPGKPRFFTIPANYFYGAEFIYIEVTPVYGTVTLYSSRMTANPGPGNFSSTLEAKESGETITLEIENPCRGYNSSNDCPPVFLGIYGKESQLSCSDRDCSLPNQIKFSIKRGAPPSSNTGVGKYHDHSLARVITAVLVNLFLSVLP